MKIIFYDTKPLEIAYLKENLKENLKDNITAYFDCQRLTDDTPIRDDYKDADAISVFVSSVLDKEVLTQFKNLKYIFLRSTGFSNTDLEYCKHNNIYVFNVPEYGSITVAEFIFSLILALTKNLIQAHTDLKEGICDHNNLIGVELNNKTLGVIGMGLIGQATARIASGFNMNVLAYDVKKDNNYNYVELDELLTKSDFISISCPLTESTRGLINKEKLALVKKDSFIINTARGEIINTEDLYYALENKQLKGAALDVIECEETLCQLNSYCGQKEYLKDICLKKYLFSNKLLKMKNVIMTSHIAYNTIEANRRIIETTLYNINSLIDNNFNINSSTKNLVLI